jgi:hypothetical protein
MLFVSENNDQSVSDDKAVPEMIETEYLKVQNNKENENN